MRNPPAKPNRTRGTPRAVSALPRPPRCGSAPPNSATFGQRYSTLEFPDSARLDDGDMWPVGFAITTETGAAADTITRLVTGAVSPAQWGAAALQP